VLQSGCQKSVVLGHNNEDISESVNSFCMGAIFPHSLGYEVSRNGFLVFVYGL